jgi:hypothetical protein
MIDIEEICKPPGGTLTDAPPGRHNVYLYGTIRIYLIHRC